MTLDNFLKEASFDLPAVHAAQSRQLHVAVAGLAKEAGVPLNGDFDMSAALNMLGRKLYIKRAEWRMVSEGINALKEIRND